MANVLFRRGTQEYINNNVPISDGQVVFNETDQAIYVDTPVNNVITRLRYGGGNLSRSDIDSALSDTSENPVQNKVITGSVLQKTDVVNDYNTAVAVTATDIPVGCGVIKTANTKIKDLQTSLNTTNGTVAQHTADISALNTGLTNISNTIQPIGSIQYGGINTLNITQQQLNTWIDVDSTLTLGVGKYVISLYAHAPNMATNTDAHISIFNDLQYPLFEKICKLKNGTNTNRDSYATITTFLALQSPYTFHPLINTNVVMSDVKIELSAIRIK